MVFRLRSFTSCNSAFRPSTSSFRAKWNLYGYVLNNPLTWVDPDGLDVLDVLQEHLDVEGAIEFYKQRESSAIQNPNRHWLMNGIAGNLWKVPRFGIELSGWKTAQVAGRNLADPCRNGWSKAWDLTKVGLAAFQWIAPLGSVGGPAGILFGRRRISGFQGIFNKGDRLRIGWSWKGTGHAGANQLTLHGGIPGTAGHWHMPSIISDYAWRDLRTGNLPRFNPWSFVKGVSY